MRLKNTWISWLLLGFMLTMMLAPLVASAQGVPPPNEGTDGAYTLPDTDLSKITFIDPLFGPISGGTQESPLTGLMLVFNGALLTVAGILVLYTILAGTLSTAHDGEMLGKRWSTLWVPLRTAIGAAAMMPVVKGGWCLAQVVVIWLAMQGAAMANLMWSKFIGDGESLIASATYTPPSMLSSVRETYTTMFVNATCVAAKEGIRQSVGDDAEIMRLMATESIITVDTPAELKIKYGPALGDTVCGYVHLKETTNGISRVWNGWTNNTGSAMFQARSDDLMLGLTQVRRAEFIAAKLETDAMAADLVRGDLTRDEFATRMDALLQSYSTNVSAAATETFAANVDQTFLTKMKADGWVMAGAFYMQLSVAQDQVTRLISNVPSVAYPGVGNSGFMSRIRDGLDWVGAPDDGTRASLRRSAEYVDQYNTDRSGGVAGGGQSTDADDGKWVTKVISWFINEEGFMSNRPADSNENPILVAKNLGDKMTATAWGAVGLGTLAAAKIGTAQGTGTAPVTLLAPIFFLIFSTLVVPGAIMSTYLPMMPYIMWLGVVLAWAIMLIEAVIAAPLWALVHLAPDGDGAVGRGGQGYMLVLSLVLRPPLMILGLVAAFVLMKPIGQLVNSTFVGAFSMSVNPGIFGLTQALAGCIIYCVVMLILIQRVFSLMHIIPDRLLRWIGGDQGGVGEQANAAGEGLTKVGGALAVQNAAGQVAQQLATGARQLNAEKISKSVGDAQNVGNAEASQHTSMKDAHASSAKADRQGDSNSHMAASEAFENAAGQNYRAAEAQAGQSARTDPEAKSFMKGLESARKAGNQGDFLSKQGEAAAQKEEAYSSARARLDDGTSTDKAADQEIAKRGAPSQFERSLAAGHRSQNAAAEHSRIARNGGSTPQSDSIRDARQPGQAGGSPGRGAGGGNQNPSVQPKDAPDWSIGPGGGSGPGGGAPPPPPPPNPDPPIQAPE